MPQQHSHFLAAFDESPRRVAAAELSRSCATGLTTPYFALPSVVPHIKPSAAAVPPPREFDDDPRHFLFNRSYNAPASCVWDHPRAADAPRAVAARLAKAEALSASAWAADERAASRHQTGVAQSVRVPLRAPRPLATRRVGT